MGFKKRLGGSSLLLFSALCGIAGSSVASAAGAEKEVAADKENLANKDADDVDDGDIDVGLDEEVVVKNEARNIAGNVAKIIIAASIIAGAAGGATYLAMNPEARKKALDYVLGQNGILGRVKDIKKQIPDFEKMIDEVIAKREAEKEKKQKEQEIAYWEELKVDVDTVLPTAGWRKDRIRWILGVFGVSLPKNAEGSRALAIVRDWLLVCGEDSNSLVYNALYFFAMVLWFVNSAVLLYKNPDILSPEYLLKSPLMMDQKTQENPWKHRALIAVVQVVDGLLSSVFPGWAFLRQGLNVVGSIVHWLKENPAEAPATQAELNTLKAKVDGLATRAELNVVIDRINEIFGDHEANLNALNKDDIEHTKHLNNLYNNIELIADINKDKFNYNKLTGELMPKNQNQGSNNNNQPQEQNNQ